MHVTYDLTAREYSIAITQTTPWAQGSIFTLRFDGPATATITTDQHVISDNGATLTVTDSGFGNVLNGLAFNETAAAIVGGQSVEFTLSGAASEVRVFQACARSLSI